MIELKSHHSRGVLWVGLAGNVDTVDAFRVFRYLEREWRKEQRNFILDLSRCQSLCPALVDACLVFWNRCEAAPEGAFRITGLSPEQKRGLGAELAALLLSQDEDTDLAA